MSISLDHLRSTGLPLVQAPPITFTGKRPATQEPVDPPVNPPVDSSVDGGTVQEVQSAMEAKAKALNLSVQLLAVDPNPPYYEQSLEWRRNRLGANSVEELCKSVVLENTKLDSAEAGRVRCVLVIVQYVAKLHKEKLIKVRDATKSIANL